MRVSNIKKSSSNFANLLKTSKNLQKCVQYLDGKNPLDLLPKGTKHSLEFVLSNVTSSFANAIRNSWVDETEVKSLEIETINTDDVFIIYEHIAKRIEAIPINQLSTVGKIITLNVVNESRKIMNVTTKDIKIDGKYNNGRIFEDVIQLIHLRPGKSLKIVMKVVKGYGKEDYNKFSNISNVIYFPVEKPLDEETGIGKSSLVSNPDAFRMGFSTYRNTSLKNIIDNGCDALSDRLKKYAREFKLPTMKGREITYSSKLLEIKTFDDVYKLSFVGEFRTIPSVICRYCYVLHPNIAFAAATIEHRSKEVGYIRLKHPEPIKLIQSAIEAILKDLDTFKKAFKDM